MSRKIEEPITVVNKTWPGGDATTTTHPAFGQISIRKPQGSIDLYGSDFTHHHFVNIEIHESELHRALSRDWTFARKLIASVSLSEAQWATFVSSFGRGEGVPCTIEYANGEGRPGLPPRQTWHLYRKEAEKSFGAALSKVKELREQLVAASTRLPKKAQVELTGPIDAVINALQSTLPFIKESFDKHIEDSIEKAKVEVNAYATNTIMRAGIAAIGNQSLIQIPEDDK